IMQRAIASIPAALRDHLDMLRLRASLLLTAISFPIAFARTSGSVDSPTPLRTPHRDTPWHRDACAISWPGKLSISAREARDGQSWPSAIREPRQSASVHAVARESSASSPAKELRRSIETILLLLAVAYTPRPARRSSYPGDH